jgi:hypothetical protein
VNLVGKRKIESMKIIVVKRKNLLIKMFSQF